MAPIERPRVSLRGKKHGRGARQRPGLRLFLSEPGRALGDYGAMLAGSPVLLAAPRGHAVLVLPGWRGALENRDRADVQRVVAVLDVQEGRVQRAHRFHRRGYSMDEVGPVGRMPS